MRNSIVFFFGAMVIMLLLITSRDNATAQWQEELKSGGSVSQFEHQYIPVSFVQRAIPRKPLHITLGPGDDRANIEVKFLDGFAVQIGPQGYPVERNARGLQSVSAMTIFRSILSGGGQWRRMAGAPEGELDRLRMNAQSYLNREIANLNNYFIIRVPEGVPAEEWIDRLNALTEVEIALPMPLPPVLPVPDFRSRQGYLNAATTGIDAAYAWSISDSGQNVTICDFEYSWNLTHRDLPSSITTFVPPGYIPSEPMPTCAGNVCVNHGTAVLGELVSKNNGWGTTGAAYGSAMRVAPTYLNNAWDIGGAMTYAITQMSRGDVILIEQQMGGPRYKGIAGNDTGLVPIEWWQSWYNTVLTAVGNGIHVVEAAGNGYQNLDDKVYSDTGNYGHRPFIAQNNSGAIIVGAGSAPAAFGGSDTARSRLAFSNYGSRLNLQGWGDTVTTTGYGTLYGAGDSAYTGRFGGTSGASPIVASAVALVESRFEALYGGEIKPLTMRSILAATGSAQRSGKFPSTQNIGPLPDVRSAVVFGNQALAGGTYQVGNSRPYLNLTAVALELSRKILTGDVIFELQSDYSTAAETFPIVFPEYTTSGGIWSVTIRPAAGVTGSVTAGKPLGDHPLIQLNGIDRLTFDGRAGGTGGTIAWIFRNTRSDSTAATVELTNGASYNHLAYLQIEGENLSGMYGTVEFNAPQGSPPNRSNRISHCDIRDRSDVPGTPYQAVYCASTVAALVDSNTIEHCNIFNCSLGLSLQGQYWTVDSNSLYQTATVTTPVTGIMISNGNGHVVTGNSIGGTAPGAGGGPLVNNSANAFQGMILGVDTLVPALVQSNTIANITYPLSGALNFMGIQINGAANIIGNTIGSPSLPGSIQFNGMSTVAGIFAVTNFPVTITGNTIANIVQLSPIPGELRGISIFGYTRYSVSGNSIHDLGPTIPPAANVVRGIYIDAFYDSALISNNMISLGGGMANNCQYEGIVDAGVAGKLIAMIVFNSVSIGGAPLGPANTYCFRRTGNSLITLRNNIFCSSRSGGPGFHYAIVNTGLIWPPASSDYNILNAANSSNLTRWLLTDMNLAAWQTASAGDFASYNADPKFIGPGTGNLHINPAVYSIADNNGVPVAGFGSDYDGEGRGTNPDIGADEYTINPPGAFTLLSPGNGNSGRPTSGSLIWHPSAASGRYDVVLDTVHPPVAVAGTVVDTSYGYAGLDSNRTYYWSVVAKNSSSNVAASGSPWSFVTGEASGVVTRTYSVSDGWNMVSVPLGVADARKASLFWTSTSTAFAYESGYLVKDTLENTKGYWLKFSGDQTVDITGSLLEQDTADVLARWNIIGSISEPVAVTSIVSEPPGIRTSDFYGFTTGYSTADTIRPGKAYWVKVSESGKLILSASGLSSAAGRIRIVPTAELPPLPPALKGEIPKAYALDQNYPNPFNPSTVISYALPFGGHVTLKVFNILGQEVARLLDGIQQAGYNSVVFEAGDLPSGIYIFRLSAGDFTQVRKMVVLR